MSKSYVTGFPRIGEQRELKFALEAYWAGRSDFERVKAVARDLRIRHLKYQQDAGIDLISVNDFSYYDQMLDLIYALNAAPERFSGLKGERLYFAMARGDDQHEAMEMTKWFNTNYHYIVPEIGRSASFNPDPEKIVSEYREAREIGIRPKVNLIGPITFLALSKSSDGSDVFAHLGDLVQAYLKLLNAIGELDSEQSVVVQLDEPVFVTDRAADLAAHIVPVYTALSAARNVRILFNTFFEHAPEAVREIVRTPVWAVGLDFVHGTSQEDSLKVLSGTDKVVFAGLINGRNVWRADLDAKVAQAREISKLIPDSRLYLGTSCSLLHVPFTLKYEDSLKIKEWLSFAVEKLDEIRLLNKLFSGEKLSDKDQELYEESKLAAQNRRTSDIINDQAVQNRAAHVTRTARQVPYEERIKLQHSILNLPELPTTTIGSFPQTQALRQVRSAWRKHLLSDENYEQEIKRYIKDCVKFQEDAGLDVLVHGEPERNDMVEYFGEQLKGYAISRNAWVQSYGSRCVKPPLLYGDVSRPRPMTVKWISYAQSLTKKPMKGMLTGPVTILNWSFVRDDIPRADIARQLALCICDEISDLQDAGIKIIQVDEAAFKEGYPLRRENRKAYEDFAVAAFRLATSSAEAKTQIHTHMCYSEFSDIISTIEALDADVLSIETARSGNELLKVFKRVGYDHEVGPGVYDIHSPRVPSVDELVSQIRQREEVLPRAQLWVNPDCGLKTRRWEEVKPSIENMVQAARIARTL
jgi:5-methyltetrahydropteroyltriglutamate--homocysteine methyltransferase